MQMIKEGDMPDGYYMSNKFFWPGDRNHWYGENKNNGHNGAGPNGGDNVMPAYLWEEITDWIFNDLAGWDTYNPTREQINTSPPPRNWGAYPKEFWNWLRDQDVGTINDEYTQKWYGFLTLDYIMENSGVDYTTFF